MKKLVIFVAVLLVLLLLPFGLKVEGSEPWYYQDDNSFEFMVPDKVQHFWGSYFISQQTSPAVSFVAGVGWEIYQDKFSIRDVVADSFGILSSELNKSSHVRMWIDYNTLNQEVLINVSYRGL